MNALRDHPADILRISGKIDHVHFATRRHDRSNRAVTQQHDAGDHRAFARFDHTGGFRFRHQGANLFIRDALLGLCRMSERLQNRASGNIQERDKGEAILAMAIMAGATRTAIFSGLRSAICFGTSSPITKDK